MPDPATYAAFLAAVIAMQLVPGPETMLVISRGIGEGRRVALWTVLGTTLAAGAIQLPLLALGIAALLRASPLAFASLRWAGAAWLAWLGLRLLWAARPAAAALPAAPRRPSALAALRDGMLANLANPQPLLFMLAFLPQFVDPARGPVALQLLLLGATQKATGFLVLSATALAAGAAGGWLARRPRRLLWQRRIAGAAMILLALYLLLDGRAAG